MRARARAPIKEVGGEERGGRRIGYHINVLVPERTTAVPIMRDDVFLSFGRT